MKIGDMIFNQKDRKDEPATITEVNVKIIDKKDKVKKEVRTVYTAEYADGTKTIFYGWDINKTVLPYMSLTEKQMSIYDFMEDGYFN